MSIEETTTRDRRAFELREQGLAYYRIADELGISPNKVAKERIADTRRCVVRERDRRRTWLSKQRPSGTRGNKPYRKPVQA